MSFPQAFCQHLDFLQGINFRGAHAINRFERHPHKQQTNHNGGEDDNEIIDKS